MSVPCSVLRSLMREFHTPLKRVTFKADCVHLGFLGIQEM